MSVLQARPDVAADEIPERGTSDIVRPPRARLVNQRHADECVLDTALARKLLDTGGYTRLPVPAVVVYRITSGTHQQTGIVVEASVRDYREGRIRGHEDTQPTRERRLDMATAEAGFEQLPVTLAHHGRDGLRALLDSVTANTPDVRVSSDAEHTHTIWVADDTELVRAVRAELSRLDTLYIADGHHRMAAAERYASRRAHPASAFTLAALFPNDQLRVLGYHRRMSRPAGYTTDELLTRVTGLTSVSGVERASDATGGRGARHEAAMRLDGEWYRVLLHPSPVHANARDSLDAVRLDEEVLAPLATATGVDPLSDVTPVPGGSAESFARWCDDHAAIGFVPDPPSVDQIMAVSDAGMIMPAKSTWFDPKVSAGLLLRELDEY